MLLKTFNDYLISPQYSSIASRDEIDLSSSLGNQKYALPIISSPMTTVTETEMAIAMQSKGGLDIIVLLIVLIFLLMLIKPVLLLAVMN